MATTFTLSKVGVAVDQLDWAIRLFLDHKRYVPAITLAAAADEVLGKQLAPDQSAYVRLRRTLATRFGDDERSIGNRLNFVRNWLKHSNRRDCSTIDVELEEVAAQLILRALTAR